MSTGPAGGGNENLKYTLMVGAALIGGMAYVSEERMSHRAEKLKWRYKKIAQAVLIGQLDA